MMDIVVIETAATLRTNFPPIAGGTVVEAVFLVKTGNLTGNTVDYSLYRISVGPWGLPRAISRSSEVDVGFPNHKGAM
jgi:hypothetical protein